MYHNQLCDIKIVLAFSFLCICLRQKFQNVIIDQHRIVNVRL